MNFGKKILISLLLCLASTSFCYAETPYKIIGGTTIKSKNSPYVQVYEYGVDDRYSHVYTSGTAALISNKHILMSAYEITHPSKPENFYVKIGGKGYVINKIQIPDNFKSDTICSNSGIAILTLNKKVSKKVKTLPITSNPDDFGVGTVASYAGFGCDTTGYDCEGADAFSEACTKCWGTLRKGSSTITELTDDMKSAVLQKDEDSNGYISEYDGDPAVTVSVTRDVIKKVKTKKGKIKKVKKTVKYDAIIGLATCFRGSYDAGKFSFQSKIPLLQDPEIIKFIKKATKNKAKIL